MISYLANPERFDRAAKRVMPFFGWGAAGCFLVGVYLALFGSPPDYQQGETIRILYIHVPAAHTGMALYLGLAVASFTYFVWRHAVADAAAEVIAPIGAVFTALMLFTGSVWGRPMWGAWWVWDARLTSALVLLLLFLGYIALRAAIEDRRQAARAGAILAMAGAINLPIIKFSVDWWASLHQSASLRLRAEDDLVTGNHVCVGDACVESAINPAQLWPLAFMALAYTLFAGWLVLYRMRSLRLQRRLEAVQRRRERADDAQEDAAEFGEDDSAAGSEGLAR